MATRQLAVPRPAVPSAVSELAATFVGLFAIAPIALVAGSGVIRGIGIAYSGMWLIAMVPSSSAYLAMLLDAFLLALRKRPLLVPAILYAHVSGRHSDRPRVRSFFSTLAAVSFYVNPLAGPAVRLLRLAIEARPEQIRALVQEIAEFTKQESDEPDSVLYSSVATQVEIAEPVWRRAEPELACM